MEHKITEVEKLMTPCGDKDHLYSWILRYTGLDFPRHTISRFSTSNPLDFIWECYSAIMDGRSLAVLGLAGRDGFKTLGLSVIDILSFVHDSRETCHIAMTKDQGSRARNYLENFINKEPLLRHAVVKQNTKHITLSIDGNQVGMEILSATPKQVQGAHCALLTFDEVASSMEPSNVKAYKDAHGILGSSRKGKPAVTVKITSRQQGFSLAEEELRNADKTGLKILKWTTLDATERCPDERSGFVPTPMWFNPIRGEKYSEAEYKNVPDAKKDGFLYTKDTFDKCLACPIAAFCAGDLKKQKSVSPLLRKIDDVIQKIRLNGSWDWAVAQIMSMRPSTEGVIYFEFDRQIHQPGWNKMWQVLTGFEAARPVTRDDFVQELKNRGANFYAGVDWGWSSPSACVIMAVDRREVCYIIECIGRTFTNDPDFVELLRTTAHRRYNIQMYCPDLANGSGNSLLKQAGLPTTDEIDKSISLGINLVKGLLRVPGSQGQTRIYIAPDLDSTVPGVAGIMEELERYHKKMDVTGKIMDNDDPEDEYNHYLDALRYMIYWLFGRMRMRIGSEYEQNLHATKPRTNVPSLDQIAREHGINYADNREVEPEHEEEAKPSGALWSWT